MTLTLLPESINELAPSTLSGALRLQVLGPLRLWRGETELDSGPRQQAYLLALLLARGGQPTGTDELIDLIWGEDAPASALNVIHKYMGSLRRLLEPELPLRGTGAYLLRRSSGYLCAAGPDVLDVARFRQGAGAARTALAEGHDAGALEHYLEALDLWSGPAGDGWTHGPAAAPIFAGLNDEYFQACVEASRAALSLGQPDRVLPALHLAAAMAPLHEPVQASLVTSLGGAGRQAEALRVFDAVRRRLADDLGIDPGAVLKAAHQQVLAQTPATSATPSQQPRAIPSPSPPLTASSSSARDRLVGRSEEMAMLLRAVEPALRNATAVVLIEGEAGAGKSRLLEEMASHAEGQGALVVWGRCLEGEGTPTMWPWVEAVTSLLSALPPARRDAWLARGLGHLVGSTADINVESAIPDGNPRFRLLEQIVDVMAESARARPLVLMLEDLQWADPTSLRLLDHLIARLPAGSAVVGSLRNQGPALGADLVRTLAAASRITGHRRVLVGPLRPDEVAELVHLETGARPTAEVAALVHARTAGNPFFVQELGRLLATGGVMTKDMVLRSGVPVTVRDVVRDRLGVLDRNAQQLLEVAALVGRSVEIALLARSVSLDVASCLERLEPLRNLGLLGPTAGDPFSYRFAHDLVRQAVSEAIVPGRAAVLHGCIADAIEEVGLSDESVAERVAHHLWAAGAAVDPARTVTALLRAGARATAKTALGAAERQLRLAVELARRSSLLGLELAALSQLIAVVGMRSMYGTASVGLQERAEQVARSLGREREAAGFLFSRWTAHGQGLEMERSTPLARRLDELSQTSEDRVVRSYGQAAAAIHEWCLGNVGASYQRLSSSDRRSEPSEQTQGVDPVGEGVQLVADGMFAEITGYHGEVAQAQAMFGALTRAAGENPFALTVAASFEARTASVVGDVAWAVRAADRGIAADPHFSFTSLGTYLRLARCWALAMGGHDPATAVVEAERIILTNLTSPVRTCVSTWYALLGEMQIAAGSLGGAAASLDRAEHSLERYGQRSAEGLVILQRAHLAQAVGDERAAISHAERARAVALRQGAHLFVQRSERFLAAMGCEAEVAGATATSAGHPVRRLRLSIP